MFTENTCGLLFLRALCVVRESREHVCQCIPTLMSRSPWWVQEYCRKSSLTGSNLKHTTNHYGLGVERLLLEITLYKVTHRAKST